MGRSESTIVSGGGRGLINLRFQSSFPRAFDCLPALFLDYPEDGGNRGLRLVDPNLSARRHIQEDQRLRHRLCGNPKSRVNSLFAGRLLSDHLLYSECSQLNAEPGILLIQ